MSELVYIAGHRGLVGSALVRRLEGRVPLLLRSHAELDLTDAAAVQSFFVEHRPAQVYLAAGRVGGIKDNATRSAEFIRDNLLIAANVIDAAWRHGTRKLLYLGSSCIYPKHAPQPIQPSALLSGSLEPTNRAYAIAKIAGVEMCRAYRAQYGFNAISAMPTNLYGPNDLFDLERSHVIPALLLRFAEAVRSGSSEVTVWGSGTPRREFLHADDLADALVCLMERYEGEEVVNVGCGSDIAIADLAVLIARTVGFAGNIRFDASQPDGTPRKLLDISAIRKLGWQPSIALEQGLQQTWRWLQAQPRSS
jgi:GDP-L-fucose synthase